MVDTIKTVLVTGAAGGVGRTICRILIDNQFQVKGLVRLEDNITGLPVEKENLIIGYVEDPQAVDKAMKGVDAVINCAALLPNALHLVAPEVFQRVNVEGSVNVLKQAVKHKVTQAIFFSTISVVDHITKVISKAEIQQYVKNNHDAYILSKVNTEKALQKQSKFFNGQLTILRPAFIYGPENFSVWREALKLVEQGKMVLIGGGDAALPLIYAEDIARFILLLLNQPLGKPTFDIYVLSSHEPTTMKQIFYFIADYLGVKRPRSVPYAPIYLAASLVSFLPKKFKVGRLKLLTKAKVSQYSKGYDLSRVIDPPPLGFIAKTHYQDGLANMLDDYKKFITLAKKT